MPPFRTVNAAIAATSAALLVTPALAAPPEKIALTGATVITGTGETIENATIVVERGLITAVGAEVELPYDATEFELEGRVVMPGMIDAHSSRGLDVANEAIPVAPFLDVIDSLDPSQLYFEDCLRDGVTTINLIPGNNTVIGGVSQVVRPIGRSPAEMTIDEGRAMKMSVTPRMGSDRMKQMVELRDALFQFEQASRDLAEQKYAEDREEAGEPVDLPPDEAAEKGAELLELDDYEITQRNLVLLNEGDLDPWIYCGRAMDVTSAIAFVNENGMADRTTLVLGADAVLAIDALKSFGRPVVVGPELWRRVRDPFTGKVEETFLPKALHDAGVEFAVLPNPDGSVAESFLNYQAAVCTRYGVPRDAAIAAITSTPASMLGLGETHGTIEEGKTGNFAVFSGDPLDFSSYVEHVFIDGIHAYDRERDPRLTEVLSLEERREKVASEGKEAESDGDGDAADSNGEDGSSESESGE